MSAAIRIAFIGFGEVNQTLAIDLRAQGICELAAWDILFKQPDSLPRRSATGSVRAAGCAADALRDATLVICAVTAQQCLSAAREAAHCLAHGTYFLDLNSASPQSKRDAAAAVEAGGGRYIEASIMSPISPQRMAAPILLGGAHAGEFVKLAHSLGFSGATFYSTVIGKAAAAKMCRSVMIKGLESLLSESLLTARHHGVEQEVLESLQNLLPHANWTQLSRYMISRSLLHGRRRAEEMREAALTVSEAGIQPYLSSATALRQDWVATLGVDPTTPTLELMLDAMLRSAGELRC